MSQVKLITKADFTEDTVYLPDSIDNERLSTCIDEAQNIDLKSEMGAAFFSALIANRAEEAYALLLDGETYVNSRDESIIFPGLKMALIYWTMSHFELVQQDTYTSHSVVRKLDSRSEPISDKSIARKSAHYRAVAASYWSDAVQYIKNYPDRFPLYKRGESPRNSSIKINAIGGCPSSNINHKRKY